MEAREIFNEGLAKEVMEVKELVGDMRFWKKLFCCFWA